MTAQFTPSSPTPVPGLVTQVVAGLARHGLSIVAGSLGTLGMLSTTQQTEFTDIGLSVVTGLFAIGWSYIQKRNVKKAT